MSCSSDGWLCKFREGSYRLVLFSGFLVKSFVLGGENAERQPKPRNGLVPRQPNAQGRPRRLWGQLHNAASAALHACCSNSSTFHANVQHRSIPDSANAQTINKGAIEKNHTTDKPTVGTHSNIYYAMLESLVR